jgi:hypothetical protein
MAQTILTLCDECLATGDEVRGEPYSVTISGPDLRATPYVLDACEQHAKPIRDMLAALAEHGRRTDRKQPLPRAIGKPSAEPEAATARAVAATDCPVCGAPSPSRTALVSHVKRVHDKSITEVEGQPMAPCPAGCGKVITTKPQGISAHLRAAHGMSRETARETARAARE